MKRAVAMEERERAKIQDRFASTIVIGACIIAAVRLAREEDVSKPTPRLMHAVIQSVSLAKMILGQVLK